MNSKKSNISRVLLSVVALLVILSVGAGVTFAWIEGGDRYSLYTDDIKLAGPALPLSGAIKTGTISLDPKKNGVVELRKVFDNTTVADSVMFTPMSSDGTNFYLPQGYDETGVPSYFREATTNDKGVKYIDFDFNVKTSTQGYIAFENDPIITVKKGNSILNDPDTSALRFMFGEKNSDNKIFFTSTTAITDGKVSVGGDETENNLVVNPISQYTNKAENKDRRLYTCGNTTTDTTFRLAIWLDCFGSSASLEALAGSEITIDLNLVIDQEKINIKFTPITLDNTGKNVENGTLGGKVNPTSKNAVIGDTQDLSTATVNDNYTFSGWFKNKTDFNDTTNRVTEENKLNAKVDGTITEYFAVFKEKPKYTITVGSLTVPSTATGGTVTIDGKADSTTDYKDKEVILKAIPEEGYRFAGWYSDSNCNTPTSDFKNPTDEGKSVTVTIDKNKNYYAKFIKQVTLTVNITGSGTVKIGNASGNPVTVDYNTPLKLTATASTGYTFDSFYDVNGGKLANNSTVTVTEDVTYTAKFNVNSYTVKFNAKTNDSVSDDGGTVSPASSTVEYNKTLKLSATPKSGYTLDGIYKVGTSSDTELSGVTESNGVYSVTITVTDDAEYYAKFVPAGTTVIFNPKDDWIHSDAWFAVYAFNSDSDYTWIAHSSAESGYYSFTIPSNYKNFIFVRLNPASDAMSWDNKWNQSEDLVVPSENNVTYVGNKLAEPCYRVVDSISSEYTYIKVSSCTWYLNDGCIPSISTGGENGTYNKTEPIMYNNSRYFRYKLPSGTTSFWLGRQNGDGVHNKHQATGKGSNNCYTVDSGGLSGKWSKLS